MVKIRVEEATPMAIFGTAFPLLRRCNFNPRNYVGNTRSEEKNTEYIFILAHFYEYM